ncbi:hypothetical protein HMPREF0262_00811 [Clostridium sp. ATCC 29733]|nr:hypothetical protein HMPREF0262_00811 [Clostridium sp. ATCC 29733]
MAAPKSFFPISSLPYANAPAPSGGADTCALLSRVSPAAPAPAAAGISRVIIQ